MSNAAGLLELLFLVLVFVVYLLLARRPGTAFAALQRSQLMCLKTRLGLKSQWVLQQRRARQKKCQRAT